MLLIRSIIRPEKADTILFELAAAGYPAVTKIDIIGRGKQMGIKVGNSLYDIPKVMLMMVVENHDKDRIIPIIMRYARTGGTGTFGDGRIFVSPISETHIISEGK